MLAPSTDNMLMRGRGKSAILATVEPRFRTAYWPDIKAVLDELGFHDLTAAALEQPETLAQFLNSLARKSPEYRIFTPGRTGFQDRSDDIRHRETLRQTQGMIVYIGKGSREVALGALELFAQRLAARGSMAIQFKQWDPLSDWKTGKQRLGEVLHFLFQTLRRQGSITCYSELNEIDQGWWEFLFNHPRVRIAWEAQALGRCAEMAQFEAYALESLPFKNLVKISQAGAWAHVVVPVTRMNIGILPDLVLALSEATRGATMELKPVLGIDGNEGPPAAHDFTEAILTIYQNPRIPLREVYPLSWVAARIDADQPLVSSNFAAGAEIAVLANGDLYAGEAAVGLEAWKLGNMADDPQEIRWERLDLLAESFSKAMKPTVCQACDWRYRCGGCDASIQLKAVHSNARNAPSVELAAEPEFQLYCAPRKALLEAMLWDASTATAQGVQRRSRELIELHQSGIDYIPATAVEEDCCS